MANRKKKNPRDYFMICRATKEEKEQKEREAKALGIKFSVYLRKLMGFVEEND